MASGEFKIQTGQFWLGEETWFDLRLTDGGWVISLCDIDHDIRYTAMIDGQKVVYYEIDKLLKFPEEEKPLPQPPEPD